MLSLRSKLLLNIGKHTDLNKFMLLHHAYERSERWDPFDFKLSHIVVF